MNWSKSAIGVLVSAALLGPAAAAAPPARLTGSIVGFVSDAGGVAQMGATVLLYSRYDRLLQRTLTNEQGAFGFDALAPDVYSLRVTLASFVPALKQHIVVQPGVRSFLAINLASVLSSIELVYTAPGQSAIMNDDWKWVLRSSIATRPVLRLMPSIDISEPGAHREHASSLFSNTRGIVKLSGGDPDFASGLGTTPDLGTAFALATSVFGGGQLKVSGNLGYAPQSGVPSAGFSTRFSPTEPGGVNPEVQLTMRQLFLPGRVGVGVVGQQNAPVLRTMALSVQDRARLGEGLQLEYGFSFESVSFLDRLNYLSPYAKLSYDLGELGSLDFGFSSGLPPAALYARNAGLGNEFQEDLATLSLFPQVTLEQGRARVERAENFEIAYHRVIGSRSVSAGVYREAVSNAALTISAPAGLFPASDLLPDLFSSASVFNIGKYRSTGYAASVSQALGDNLSLGVAYGNGGVLRTDGRELGANNPADLRAMVRGARRDWLMGKVSATLPGAGTRVASTYQWTDYRSLTPGHRFLTQRMNPEAGLNVHLRQPIPSLTRMPGRLEATAELRNMLAQGYLPIATPGGRRILLIHSPRAVRGSLSFIF